MCRCSYGGGTSLGPNSKYKTDEHDSHGGIPQCNSRVAGMRLGGIATGGAMSVWSFVLNTVKDAHDEAEK